jgi:hypothetical protein
VRGVGYCFRRDLPIEVPRMPSFMRPMPVRTDYASPAF